MKDDLAAVQTNGGNANLLSPRFAVTALDAAREFLKQPDGHVICLDQGELLCSISVSLIMSLHLALTRTYEQRISWGHR